MTSFKRIAVYCGSSSGHDPTYKVYARAMGKLMAEENIELIYGGGGIGLMRAVADGVLEHGGKVTGVITHQLKALELAHPDIQVTHVTESMHQRKHLMASLSDAFIALPGGWGTLEELSEVTTWTQLNLHRKPVGLLNVNGYYDAFINWISTANQAGFIRDQHVGLISIDKDPATLLKKMEAQSFPELKSILTNID